MGTGGILDAVKVAGAWD